MKMTILYHYLMAHRVEIVAGGTLLFALCYVLAAIVCAWWAATEERRHADERARFEKIIQANEPPRHWPTPKGPHGFKRNGRIAS